MKYQRSIEKSISTFAKISSNNNVISPMRIFLSSSSNDKIFGNILWKRKRFDVSKQRKVND